MSTEELVRFTKHSESSIFEREIKEDVLPFLLQTQDIITKLESRVVGLENDLAAIYCKYEQDQKEWSINLDKKNKDIDSLSSKLSRLEFNSKETILLLSELDSDHDQTNVIIDLCLRYLRQTDSTQPDESRKRFSEANPILQPRSERAKSSIYCTHCKPLLTQLNAQIEKKAYLRRDLGSLATALSNQESMCAVLEQEKRQLESEVQTMTRTLFSALNQFWMDEAMDRACLALLEPELQLKLTAVQRPPREPRLNEMKACLVRLDSALKKSTQTSGALTRHVSCPGLSQRISLCKVEEEDPVLKEFEHHLQAIQAASVVLPLTDFVKRVSVEDIEPCLFFGASLAWWKTTGFKKRLTEALLKDTCLVKSGTFADTRCVCCHRSQLTPFVLYLNQTPQGAIDRFCRERLLAVSGYYRFMTRLRPLVNTRPLLELFQQVTLHRNRMCQSRRASNSADNPLDSSSSNELFPS